LPTKLAISLALTPLLVVSGLASARHESKASPTLALKQQQSAETVQRLHPNPIFGEILTELKQKTHVPLRLPAYWPFSERVPDDKLKKDQGEENLYATIVDVSDRHYAIQMAFGRDCQGQHVCRDGGLTGSGEFHDDYPERPKVSVQLMENIPGKFVDAQCGAYCDESVLYWSENGYHYSVSSKAAKKDELMKIANSAIQVAKTESRRAHQIESDEQDLAAAKQEKANP
jgi:hypothetical protein